MEKRTEMKNRGMPPLHLAAARKNKRGVSPIIATILLVAITVVIAAVLYVLVSGYLKGTGSAPNSFQLQTPNYGKCTAVGTPVGCTAVGDYIITFGTVTATSGLTINSVGLKVVDVNGGVVSYTQATLIGPTGSVVATYTAAGGWSTNAAIGSGDSLALDTGTSNLQGTGDTVQAYGLGGASVSGGYSAGL